MNNLEEEKDRKYIILRRKRDLRTKKSEKEFAWTRDRETYTAFPREIQIKYWNGLKEANTIIYPIFI